MESRRQGRPEAQLEEGNSGSLNKRMGNCKKGDCSVPDPGSEAKEQAAGVEKSIEALNQERLELEKQSARLRAEEREKQSQRELTGRELARLEERKANLQKGI